MTFVILRPFSFPESDAIHTTMSEETSTTQSFMESAYKLIDRYAIRYTVGTIVGALVVSALYAEYMGDKAKFSEALKQEHFALIAALGFAWCFIASAPVYALHASRSLFIPATSVARRNNHIGMGALFGIWGALAIYFACKIDDWFVGITSAGFIAALLFQTLVVFYAMHKREEIYAWYRTLALRRNSAKGDLVESYRTLREYGNAYQIIVLEIALGLVLAGLIRAPATKGWFMEDPGPALGIALSVWVMPGYFAYGIAQRLEADFQADK